MKQKHQVTATLLLQALLVVMVIVAVASRRIPVGVPGEWEWNRLADWAKLPWDGLMIAGTGVAVYAAYVTLGSRLLAAKRSRMSRTGVCDRSVLRIASAFR